MATLDTTLLIRPTPTPPSTTTIQPKPAEGFQRLLDDETHKVGNPVPQPKATTSGSGTPHEALRPTTKSSRETKTRSEQDSTGAQRTVKPEAGPAGARNEVPAKVTRRRAVMRDSKPEATDSSVELAAESAPRQELPSEKVQEVSGSSISIFKEDTAQVVESPESAPVAQRASVAALLAS